MVKKKIHRPAVQQLLHRPPPNGNCNCNCKHSKPSSSSTHDQDSADLELMDHSIIREPINLGQKNVRQILTCVSKGTAEAKDLVLNECNIIYECRVCQNLFRSLANFIAHKRIYCKSHCCEDMVLYDPQTINTLKQSNDNNDSSTVTNGPSETVTQSTENTDLTEEKKTVESNNEDQSINTNLTESSTQSIETNLEVEHTQNVFPKRSSPPVPIEKGCKRQRLENIVTNLKSQTDKTDSEVKHEENMNVEHHEPPLSHPNIEFFTENFAELETNFNHDDWKSFRKNAQRRNNFLYKCPCGMEINYIFNAIRHLTNQHRISKQKAKVLVFWNHQFKVNPLKAEGEESCQSTNCDINLTAEPKSDSASFPQEQISNEKETFKSENSDNSLSSAPANVYNSDSNPQITELSASHEFPQKRYSTRHRRKKCFFDCELGTDNFCPYHSKYYKQHPDEFDPKKDVHDKAFQISLPESLAKSDNLEVKAECDMNAKKSVSIRISKTNSTFTVDSDEKPSIDSSEQTKASGITDVENLSEDDSHKVEISRQTEIADLPPLSCAMCPEDSFDTIELLQHHMTSHHITENHVKYACASPPHSPMRHFPPISSSDHSESSESNGSPKLITKLSIKNLKQVSSIPNETASLGDSYKNKSDSKLKLHLRPIGSKKYQIVNNM